MALCSMQKNGDEGGKDIMKKHRRQVLFSGIITAVGLDTLSICLFPLECRLIVIVLQIFILVQSLEILRHFIWFK